MLWFPGPRWPQDLPGLRPNRMSYCAVMSSMGQCLYWQQDLWALWSVGDVKSLRSLLMIWWYLMGAFEQAMHQWMGRFATREALESLEEMWQAVVTPVSWQWLCQSPMWDASRKSQHGTFQKAVENEISGRDDFVTLFCGGFYEIFMDIHGISAYLGGYVVGKKDEGNKILHWMTTVLCCFSIGMVNSHWRHPAFSWGCRH